MKSAKKTAALNVIRGVLTACACTLAGMLALGLLAGYTGISDNAIQTANQCVKLISVILGALTAVRVGGEKGLLKGALVGLIYMLLGLASISLLISAQADWSVMLGELTISAVVGAAAGALFANLPVRARARQ